MTPDRARPPAPRPAPRGPGRPEPRRPRRRPGSWAGRRRAARPAPEPDTDGPDAGGPRLEHRPTLGDDGGLTNCPRESRTVTARYAPHGIAASALPPRGEVRSLALPNTHRAHSGALRLLGGCSPVSDSRTRPARRRLPLRTPRPGPGAWPAGPDAAACFRAGPLAGEPRAPAPTSHAVSPAPTSGAAAGTVPEHPLHKHGSTPV